MTNDAPPWWAGDYEDPFDDQLHQYVHEAVEKLRKRGRSPMECIEIISDGRPISVPFSLTWSTAEKLIFLELKRQIQQVVNNNEFPF